MIKPSLSAAAALALTACAAIGGSGGTQGSIARVNPASIAANPAAWDGRQVEVTGLLVWEPGHLGLYQSYGAYCRRGTNTAIHVDWPDWRGVTQADSRRTVTVRGLFRNRSGATQPGTTATAASAAAGPGPLEPGSVVRWLSPPAKACPATR